MIVSILLLAYGFVSRSIRLFEATSTAVERHCSQTASDLAHKFLVRIAGQTTRQRARRALFVNPLLAGFLTLRLNLDLFTSMLAEVRLYCTLITHFPRRVENNTADI